MQRATARTAAYFGVAGDRAGEADMGLLVTWNKWAGGLPGAGGKGVTRRKGVKGRYGSVTGRGLGTAPCPACSRKGMSTHEHGGVDFEQFAKV
jgi:hypothetical protein